MNYQQQQQQQQQGGQAVDPAAHAAAWAAYYAVSASFDMLDRGQRIGTFLVRRYKD